MIVCATLDTLVFLNIIIESNIVFSTQNYTVLPPHKFYLTQYVYFSILAAYLKEEIWAKVRRKVENL